MSKYFCDPSLPSQMFSIAALVPEMISSRLFNSLVAAVGDLIRAPLSEGSGFMKANSEVGWQALTARSAGIPLNLIKQDKCRKEGARQSESALRCSSLTPAGISPLANPSKLAIFSFPRNEPIVYSQPARLHRGARDYSWPFP